MQYPNELPSDHILEILGIEKQIKRISKPHRYSPVEHIKAVGGDDWWLDVRDVISAIRDGRTAYYTRVIGRPEKARVVIGKSNIEREFIKTEPNDTLEDNLLSLPNYTADGQRLIIDDFPLGPRGGLGAFIESNSPHHDSFSGGIGALLKALR